MLFSDIFKERDEDFGNYEQDGFDTSEPINIPKPRAINKTKLVLSDFYSDETNLKRDLLWKYLIYVNMLRNKEMNYSEFNSQCYLNFQDALKQTKISITETILREKPDLEDIDTFFDVLESKIDIFASNCLDVLDYKSHSGFIEVESFSNYGPVVVSHLSQLKMLTLRLKESKRKKLSHCAKRLLDCMYQVGMAICDSRVTDFKHKTFDLCSKVDNMLGRNDFFTYYRSNLLNRYINQKGSIEDFINSDYAQTLIGDEGFDFNANFDFISKIMHEESILQSVQPVVTQEYEAHVDMIDVDTKVVEEEPEKVEIDIQLTKELEMARNKASAILRKKRELQKKIQNQDDSNV